MRITYPSVVSKMLLETFFLIFLALFFGCIYDCLKPNKFPPGPFWLPVIGCYPIFRQLRSKYGYAYMAFKQLEETYGPVLGLKLGRQKLVVISGYHLVKKASLQDDFNGRPDGYFFRVRAFGKKKGVLFTEGQTWSQLRKFTMRHLRTFGFGGTRMNARLITEAQSLVDNLRRRSENGPIAMHKAFDIAVLNALWIMIAGRRLEYDDEKSKEILQTVDDAFKVTDTMGGLLSQMPFLRFVIPELSGYNGLMRILQKLWKFLDEEIIEHEKKITGEEPKDLIEAFLLETASQNSKKDGNIFDRENLLILCLDLFLAGSQTTTDTLGAMIMYLSLNPKWIEILQKELDNQTGGTRPPTFEDSSSLPMIEAFIAEVERYLILAPLGVPHKTMNDVNFNGYLIPKDTLILFDFYSVHNDPAYWSNPEEFRPERFLDERGQFSQQTANMPFGSGKRRCLGEILARSSSYIYLVYFLHYFDFEISPFHDKPDPNGYDGFTISPKPYYLKLSMRSSMKH